MLEINFADVAWLDKATLERRLRQSADALRVTMTIPNLYQAQSATEISDNWLKAWYISEVLAGCAMVAQCSFKEAGAGEGRFDFHFQDVNAGEMADKLVAFGDSFDPDELEASALIYDEAADWLEKKGDSRSRFPDIERCYWDDKEQSDESERDDD